MISKKHLLGKHIAYRDKDGKHRISKCVRIDGNTLTLKRASGVKERIHRDRIQGRQYRKRGIEPIQWG